MKIYFPAPRRCWSCTSFEEGKPLFSSHAWTAYDVESARTAGAYFEHSCHDFQDKDAERAAFIRLLPPCSKSSDS